MPVCSTAMHTSALAKAKPVLGQHVLGPTPQVAGPDSGDAWRTTASGHRAAGTFHHEPVAPGMVAP